MSVFFTLCAFEIGARIYLHHFADLSVFQKYATKAQLFKQPRGLSPHIYLGYYPTPNYEKGDQKHNSLGYRGEEIDLPKPQGRFRIVCIGGSTTYTTRVKDYRLSYPALLEKELKNRGYSNVDVVNAGVVGYSSWETLISLAFRVLDVQPDLIIVYHGINDANARLVWPAAAYKGDDSGRRAPTVNASQPAIVRNLTILRILMVKLGCPTAYALYHDSIMKDAHTYRAVEFRDQKQKGEYPDNIFKEVSAEEMFRTNRPVYFERNIRNIIAIAKSNGIQVILPSFATCSDFPEYPRVSSPEYIRVYREQNEIIRSIADDTGVYFFDFVNIFPNKRDYYTDGRHVNLAGSKLKAKLFADYIVDRNIVPRPD